jgi:outer membrane protein OmpA-like peptidoglycan-associated protein
VFNGAHDWRHRNLKDTIMKNNHFTLTLFAAAVFLSACSSLPTNTSLLDQTRSDYRAAQSNPNVTSYAGVEMKQARIAMEQANAAASDSDSNEKVDKLAYLARQKIALTQEVAKQKSAEANIVSAAKQRDQLRLDSRTNEANQAKLGAEQSRLTAQAAQDETIETQRNMQDAQARTAQLEAQLTDLSARKTDRGMVITLSDVLFGTDMTRLNPDGMRTAQKLADMLQQNPHRSVLIEGFTDSTGGAAHNQALSERRATAVRTALSDMGVLPDRVAIRGYGQAYPVAANDTAQNRQLNRRVEIIVSDAPGNIAQR